MRCNGGKLFSDRLSFTGPPINHACPLSWANKAQQKCELLFYILIVASVSIENLMIYLLVATGRYIYLPALSPALPPPTLGSMLDSHQDLKLWTSLSSYKTLLDR